MPAVDFVLYCCGVGILVISATGAVRLLFGPRSARLPSSTPPARVPDEAGPVGDALNDRLLAFQATRYATPLRSPPSERQPTPGEPGSPRVVPPIKGRTFSVPKQPTRKGPPPLPKQDADVIPFPLKMKRDPTKKD